MLPKYDPPLLTLSRLSQELVNTALERCESTVPTGVACLCIYDWLGHSYVQAENMQDFEAASGLDGEDALNAVIELANEMQDLLIGEDIVVYRERHISTAAVSAAMRKIGLTGDPEHIGNLLAAYMVAGKSELEKNYLPYLEAYKLTVDDIAQLTRKVEL